MTDSTAPTSARFETPLLDSLIPKQQELVRQYVKVFDRVEAARIAGYSNNNNQLYETAQRLFTKPEVVAAIDELLNAMLAQIDESKAAICQRLQNQSLADITDVAERVPYKSGFDKEVKGKFMWQAKDPADVEPRFHCAMGFLKIMKDGTLHWDNVAQARAQKQLSELMMWDQQILDVNPPLVFNFGDIQQQEYTPPSDDVDLSTVEDESDEVSSLVA